MITILQEPKEFDFTGNGLPFEIQGEGIVINSGIEGYLKLKLVDGGEIVDGEILQFLNFATQAPFQLTAKLNPINPNEFQPTGDLRQLTNDLNDIPVFYQFYNAILHEEHEGPNVYLTLIIVPAINQNTDWSITTASLPTDMYVYSQLAGVEGTPAEDYSYVGVLSKINIDDSLTELSTFELIPDSDLKAEVKLGSILKDYIARELPDLDSTQLLEFEVDEYRLEFAEKYRVGNSLVTYPSVSKDYFVFDGKIPFETYPDFDVKTFSSVNDNFLSWADGVHYIWPGFNSFLYFLSEFTTHYYLGLKIYYTDGTSHEDQISDLSSIADTVVEMPCSLEKLNLGQYQTSKEIYKYELTLTLLNGIPLTKTMTFLVIKKPLYARQFMFLNSFGVWEFFYTKGKRTEKLKTKRSLYKKDISIGYLSFGFEIASNLEEAYNIFDIETGSIARKESQNLSNMFASKYLFEIIDDKYLRCQLIAGTTDIVPDDEDLFSVKFSYRYAFDR